MKKSLIYYNTYCHQTCQSGELLQDAPTFKSHNRLVLWFWFSPVQFVRLKRKRLVVTNFLFSFFFFAAACLEYCGIWSKKNILQTIKQLL